MDSTRDTAPPASVEQPSVEPRSVLRAVVSLLRTSRPLGWVAALALFRTGMAYGNVPDTWVTTGMSVAVTLPFCLFLFGLNDLADSASDRLNPRKGNWIHGADEIPEVPARLHRLAPWLAGAFVAAWLPWLPWRSSLVMALVLLVSWAYSSYPVRLKEVPIVDGLVTASIMIGLLGIGYWAGGNAQPISPESWSVAPTLAGLHIFASVADEQSDRGAGHRTLAVRLGGKAAGYVSFALSLLGVATIFVLDYAEPIEVYMTFQVAVIGAWLAFDRFTMRLSMVLLGGAGIVTLVFMAAFYMRMF